MSNTGFILTTPEEISRFSLASLRGRLRLEAVGMKGRGKSALSIAKAQGFKGNRAEIIAEITAKLNAAK